MEFLETATKITPELAEYVSSIAESDLSFVGEHPLEHSRTNHQHLWKIEWLANDHPQIDLEIRRRAVEYILARWRVRLKSYHPYLKSGYRFFLYEDAAPTVSVVAETPYGFPYGGEPHFVNEMATVLQPYVRQPWRTRLSDAAFRPKDEKNILEVIEDARGSLGTRAAQRLGLTVAELRKHIEWLEITDQVNKVRKQFRRRPANLSRFEELPFRYRIFELRLPPRY
jgi:hypothetical protein